MVFPISKGLERNQLPIYSAMRLRLRVPFALERPRIIENASYESSVGCPGSRWCFPPPEILKAFLILSGVMSLSNYRGAPMTSPRTAPQMAPVICSFMFLTSIDITNILLPFMSHLSKGSYCIAKG